MESPWNIIEFTGRLRSRRLDLDVARGDGFEPGEDAQQRRLAAAARADDHEELAVRDVDRDVVDGDQAAELLERSRMRIAGRVGSGSAVSILASGRRMT